MTDRFLAMFPWLFDIEGRAYENDPSDPGGATRFGIDQRSHPNVDIKNLTEEEAKKIYWDSYWQKNSCERFDFPIGEAYFDICVNNGAGRAAQLLAISNSCQQLIANRDAFYRRLAARRPKSRKYLQGWLNRDISLRKHLNIT